MEILLVTIVIISYYVFIITFSRRVCVCVVVMFGVTSFTGLSPPLPKRHRKPQVLSGERCPALSKEKLPLEQVNVQFYVLYNINIIIVSISHSPTTTKYCVAMH